MQQPAVTPQQEAISEVRTRYEKGLLTFEQFEYALNALLQAHTPEEYQGIIQELSAPEHTVLDALTPSAPVAARVPPEVRMFNIVGELKRTRRPWKMGQRTIVWMGMGALKLDLSKATLPPQAVLEVYSLMGESKIYVPSTIHVTLRQFTLMGENKALGEERNGIFTMLDEEFPAEGPEAASAPHLIIHQIMLIGSAQIIRSGQRGWLSRIGAMVSGLAEDLTGINLSGANLEHASFRGKNMEKARLVGANLQGADLHGANLRGANLLGANLEDADLSGADLHDARMLGANLNGTNLTGT
jgi:hypothetical protein